MIYLFEEWEYESKYLGGLIDLDREDGFNTLDVTSSKKNGVAHTKVRGVGYYHHNGHTVFVLPKVFVDHKTGKAFGEEINSKGEDVFGNVTKNFKNTDPAREFLSGLGLWLYSAIKKYRDNSPKKSTGTISFENLESVKFKKNDRFSTLPDVVSSMELFYKKNQSLFVFVAKCKHSGNHKIDWHKTVSKKTPFLQNGTPIYMETINKVKAFDLDDRLLVLYFSAMNYIQSEYGLKMPKSEFYQPLKVVEVKRLLEDERGVRELRRIKYKYFDDRLLKLFNIVEAFFRWGAEFTKKNSKAKEYLIVNSFNNVFEAMIDELIGDLDANVQKLKKNDDGKIIDHLYKERSLIFAEDGTSNTNKIWHIGDSKYYKDDNELDTKSIAKQFTYAKNLIQDFFSAKYFELDAEGKPKCVPKSIHKQVHYRDGLTEGYNITPNFFIRGYMPVPEATGQEFSFADREKYLRQNKDGDEYVDELIDYDAVVSEGKSILDSEENSGKKSLWEIRNRHFENRLFDRDTLLLQVYNVNFLYVLKAYTSPGPALRDQFKYAAHKMFREKFLMLLENKYAFWLVWPHKTAEDANDFAAMKRFVDTHYRTLQGKSFRPQEFEKCLIVALEKDYATSDKSDEFWREIEDECDTILPVSPEELWNDAVYVKRAERIKEKNVPRTESRDEDHKESLTKAQIRAL